MLKIAGVDGNSQLNAIASSDTLSIYDLSITGDSAPTTCEDSATGTLLTSFGLSSPWAGSASGGQRTLNGTPILSASVATTGIPAYFRFTSSGTCIMQGTVGRSGTLDPNGQPWDITTDGLRFIVGTNITLKQLSFVAVNNDA